MYIVYCTYVSPVTQLMPLLLRSILGLKSFVKDDYLDQQVVSCTVPLNVAYLYYLLRGRFGEPKIVIMEGSFN